MVSVMPLHVPVSKSAHLSNTAHTARRWEARAFLRTGCLPVVNVTVGMLTLHATLRTLCHCPLR